MGETERRPPRKRKRLQNFNKKKMNLKKKIFFGGEN